MLESWVAGVTAGSWDGEGARSVYWLDQVHGSSVVTVGTPSRPSGGSESGSSGGPAGHGMGSVFAGSGDALVSRSSSCALGVLTADCASIALGSPEGVFGAVHAGWRGLVAGVVERAVAVMREMGATDVAAALGPCIHASCYEFSEQDLADVAAVYGDRVRSTSAGGPALDVPVAVSAALEAGGAREVAGWEACTACEGEFFSHRARADTGRQALVVWSSSPGDPG
jgi:polyphenol oxidase